MTLSMAFNRQQGNRPPPRIDFTVESNRHAEADCITQSCGWSRRATAHTRLICVKIAERRSTRCRGNVLDVTSVSTVATSRGNVFGRHAEAPVAISATLGPPASSRYHISRQRIGMNS